MDALGTVQSVGPDAPLGTLAAWWDADPREVEKAAMNAARGALVAVEEQDPDAPPAL
ncbi:MAG: hypothetical protein JXB39_06020 [Deltaproteobacteria bacterium]|nr:hypothetical protein [Deltaproteobacteria bacterium]